jgi:hypothetical protein
MGWGEDRGTRVPALPSNSSPTPYKIGKGKSGPLAPAPVRERSTISRVIIVEGYEP